MINRDIYIQRKRGRDRRVREREGEKERDRRVREGEGEKEREWGGRKRKETICS